jgi:hypothetical protein
MIGTTEVPSEQLPAAKEAIQRFSFAGVKKLSKALCRKDNAYGGSDPRVEFGRPRGR